MSLEYSVTLVATFESDIFDEETPFDEDYVKGVITNGAAGMGFDVVEFESVQLDTTDEREYIATIEVVLDVEAEVNSALENVYSWEDLIDITIKKKE